MAATKPRGKQLDITCGRIWLADGSHIEAVIGDPARETRPVIVYVWRKGNNLIVTLANPRDYQQFQVSDKAIKAIRERRR